MTSLKSALSKDVIEVGQQFYIRASSSLADDRTRVLLNGDTFAVFDRGVRERRRILAFLTCPFRAPPVVFDSIPQGVAWADLLMPLWG